MPKNIEVDQEVFVPRARVGLDPSTPAGPFYRTKVRHVQKRSVKVDVPPGPLDVSNWIGTSKIALRIGVLIVRIGDYKESELIEPLCKSVLYFCRMLVPGNLEVIEVRTVRELIHFWTALHAGFQQVILIGHGDHGNIYFGTHAVSAPVLGKIFSMPTPEPKEFISLCCQTGQQPFAKAFSVSSACSALVAPFHSVHGVTASQFCQAYLTRRLLEACSVGIAFNQARKILLGTASFRLWQNGALKAGPK